MKNYVIQKFDLIKFNKEQTIKVQSSAGQYMLLQMLRLRSKNPSDYRPDWLSLGHNRWRDACAFIGLDLQVDIPAGTELKFHDVENPTRAACQFRDPEFIVAHILGLDMTNKAEKKLAKLLGKSIGRVYVDLTVFEPGTFEIIPDSKSASQRRNTAASVFFGKPATAASMEEGKVYLASLRDGRKYRNELWFISDEEGRHNVISHGDCLTVVGCERVGLDERIPELFYKDIRFLVVSADTTNARICTATVSGNDTTPIVSLIEAS